MAFTQRGIPDTFTAGGVAFPRGATRSSVIYGQQPRNASLGSARTLGRVPSPRRVTASAAPVLAERNFVPPQQESFDKKVSPTAQTTSRRLPSEFYQLTNVDACVQLPPHHLVDPRSLDNRELDKLVSQLGKNKNTWRRALMLHEWLVQAGHVPDDRLCTTLIRVCGQHGHTGGALGVYQWMKEQPECGGAGLCPSVYTYTAAMRAALAGNVLDKALQIWEDVEQSGCAPDSRLCTAYIEVCTRLGYTEKALNMYHRMRNSQPPSKMAPTVHAYTAAMRAATEGGKWEKSLDIWEDMLAAGVRPSGHAFAAAISSCAAGNQWHKACDLFESMLRHGIQPDVVSCTALISALATGGQWQQSEQVVSWMLQSGVRPNVRTYTALLNSLGQAQQWQRAVTLLKRMSEQEFGAVEPNAYCVSALLKALGEHGQWEVAERVFSDLEEEAFEINSETMVPNGNLSGMEVMEMVMKLGLLPDCNQTVGMQRTQNNEMLSRAVLNNAVDVQLPFHNSESEGSIWSTVDFGFSSTAPVNQTINFAPSNSLSSSSDGMDSPSVQPSEHNITKKSGRPRHPKINEVVCGALMMAYSRAGKWGDAVNVLNRARRLGIRPNTVMYNSAISAAGKNGQVDICEILFNEVEDPDAITYETVIAAYGMAGLVMKAESAFGQMLSSNFQPRDYAYCGLIAAHSMAGDWESALNVRTRMQRAMATLTVHVYNALIAACERCGRLDHALRLQKCMEQEGIEPNNVTLSLLNSISKQGIRAADHQQIGATALSAVVAAAGAYLMQSGVM